MKSPFAVFVICMASMLVASCQNSASAQVSPRDEKIAVIDSLETILKAADGDMDTALGMQMIRAYVEFGENFPEDSMAIKYWYRAGEVARNIPRQEMFAIAYYSNIHQDHPDHPLADEAIFMTGVCFDQLGDKERSSKTFSYFLETYPDHPWAPQAQELLFLNTEPADLEDQVGDWLENAKKE